MDLSDLYQFKVTFNKYGTIKFECCNIEKILDDNDKSDDKILSSLFLLCRVKENDNDSNSEIELTNVTFEERKSFIYTFFKKQYPEYKFNKDISIFDNLKLAYAEQELKQQENFMKITSPILEQQNYINKVLQSSKSLLPVRNTQTEFSNKIDAVGLNGIAKELKNIGLNSKVNRLGNIGLSGIIKEIDSMQSSMNLLKSSLSLTQFENITTLLNSPTIRTIENLSNNLETINKIQNLYSNTFSFSKGFSNYTNVIYANLTSNWNLLYSDEDNIEPIIETNGIITNASNAKDIVGSKELFSDISEEEIANFLGLLEKYPFFASQDKIGKKIYEELKNYAQNNIVTVENQIFFRARKWEKNQDCSYTINDMWKPPFGIPKQARFNTTGVSYLYLTDSSEIAKKEIEAKSKEKYSIMSLKNKVSFYIFDMAKKGNIIFEYCTKKNLEKNYRQYLLPNYIAQCLDLISKNENIHIDGIRYESSKNSKNGHCYNFVLFDKYSDDFIESKIIS